MSVGDDRLVSLRMPYAGCVIRRRAAKKDRTDGFPCGLVLLCRDERRTFRPIFIPGRDLSGHKQLLAVHDVDAGLNGNGFGAFQLLGEDKAACEVVDAGLDCVRR